MLSLACVGAALERRHQQDARGRPGHDLALPRVDVGDAYYLLNPDGDLAPTQAAFERWFASLRGWQVCKRPLETARQPLMTAFKLRTPLCAPH